MAYTSPLKQLDVVLVRLYKKFVNVVMILWKAIVVLLSLQKNLVTCGSHKSVEELAVHTNILQTPHQDSYSGPN
jgi:hypothetical protein